MFLQSGNGGLKIIIYSLVVRMNSSLKPSVPGVFFQ